MLAPGVSAPLPGFGPLAPQERIETLDILRGFALFCILVVNWTVNTLWDTDSWGGYGGAADQIAFWIASFLLDNKSWPMFAFLFGLGFAIQMQRAEARGAPFVATYTRRLAVLFLIGAAHFILTERDILFEFALFGFLLLPLRKLNPNLLVGLALICVLVPFIRDTPNVRDRQLRLASSNNARVEITLDSTVLDTYVGVYELASIPYTIFVIRKGDALFGQSPGYPGDTDVPFRLIAESATEFFSRSQNVQVSFVREATGTVTGLVLHEGGQDASGRLIQPGPQTIDEEALRRVATQGPRGRAYATGTFGEIVSLRAGLFREEISSWTTSYVNWLSDVFAIFLLGLYAGRRRIFHDVATHREFIRKVMWWGFALGLAGITFLRVVQAVGRSGESIPFMAGAVAHLGDRLGDPALGLAYLATLTLLLQRETWKRRLVPLGAVGRMALTNYLAQSVAFVLLFFGYGLGWYGQVGAFGGVVLAVAFFVLQIVASQWWLRRFRFGPVEWLWRTLTYGEAQPMRSRGP